MAGVPHNSNTAVIFSTTMPLDHQDQFYAHKHGASSKRLGPRKLIDSLPGATPALISSTFGFDGISVGMSAACATGLSSIDYAVRCLEDYDYVVVGAAESPSPTTASLFGTLGALSNESRPFDQKRDGFVLGEGAGCLVLESEAKAKARGARILARLHKPGMAIDHGTDVAPDPDGIGAIAAMQSALSYAGIQPTDIDYVNAHATSTVLGDLAEYKAVRSLTPAPMYSCKGMIGHLLTSAGINELIYAILFAERGHGGFNAKLDQPIEGAHSLPTAPSSTAKSTITTLKNSFGFGRRCASIVLEVDRV
jgi:3-oxoacyl-[acyl-carrier-protein] synthase II